MIRSIARAIAGSVSTPITGSGPTEPQAPIIASVTISGGTSVGSVLSSSIAYTQVPVPSATPTYQWDRNGSPISGATSASYTLVEADAGAAITLDVSVTNSEGSDSATSNTINAAALAAPVITGVPTISGTLFEGNTLTATAASVTGNPSPATTWQWERDGTPISGATSQTYTLVSADGNADITVVQTETNSQGSATAESAASTIEAAPLISGVPTLSGTETVGSTLTATAASVTGTPTPTRSWQWQRSANGTTGWADISGATSSTYTLVVADENQYVRAVQSESNALGDDEQPSASSGQIGPEVSDPYIANGFSPDFVVDESATSAPLYRSGGTTATYSDIYTTDTTAGGLCTQNDSSGNLVWGPHNLVRYSEQFDNAAWSKTNGSITANSGSDPAGGSTADLFTENTSSGAHSLVQSSLPNVVSGANYTFAVVAETNGRDIQLVGGGGAFGLNAYVNFDLSAAQVGVEGSAVVSSSATSLGGGLVLCVAVLQATASAVSDFNIWLIQDAATSARVESYTGDGSSGVYFWGAHYYRSDLGGMADVPADVRSTSALDKYVATTSAAKYLIRRRHYRYNGTSYVPTLLHEPVGATNDLDYSRIDSNWTNGAAPNLTLTENNAAGIDGNTSATTLQESAVNDAWWISEAVTSSTGQRVMWAIARLVSGTRYLQIRPGGLGAGVAFATFELTGSGSVVGSGGSEFDSAGIRQWSGDYYLCWMAADYSVSPSTMAIYLANVTTEAPTYTGSAGVEFAIAHCQTEDGLVPSSPIITTGASVTRSADTCKVKAAALPYDSTAISTAVAIRSAYDGSNAHSFFDWYESSSGRIVMRVNGSTDKYEAYFSTPGLNDISASAASISTGPAVQINAAGRFVPASEVQGALTGVASTATSTSVTMPTLSDDNLSVGITGAGTSGSAIQVDTIRLWSDDIAEAGIESGSASVEIQGLPTISGTEAVGSTLTASAATVVGGPSPSTTWQWQRSANGTSGWADISGATSSTYTLVSADEDQYVRAVQTATATAGGDTYTDSANSVASGQIQPSAATLPLDGVTVDAAYSIDRLYTSYTGSLLAVRRSADSAEADVAYDASNTLSMDSPVTITSGSSSATNLGQFVAASGYTDVDSLGSAADALVTSWYDQSGNSVDIAQSVAANQLQLISAGAFLTAGSRPALKFVSDDYLDFPAGYAQAASLTVYGVVDTTAVTVGYKGFLERTSPSGSNLVLLMFGSGTFRPAVYWNSQQAMWGSDVQSQELIRWRYGSGLTGVRVGSGAEVTDTIGVGTARTDWLRLGGSTIQPPDGGLVQEVILYPGYATAGDDTQISDSIGTRFGVTVP